jgi:hypothetical protein
LDGRSDETDENGRPVRRSSDRPRLSKRSVFDINAKKPEASKPAI